MWPNTSDSHTWRVQNISNPNIKHNLECYFEQHGQSNCKMPFRDYVIIASFHRTRKLCTQAALEGVIRALYHTVVDAMNEARIFTQWPSVGEETGGHPSRKKLVVIRRGSDWWLGRNWWSSVQQQIGGHLYRKKLVATRRGRDWWASVEEETGGHLSEKNLMAIRRRSNLRSTVE